MLIRGPFNIFVAATSAAIVGAGGYFLRYFVEQKQRASEAKEQELLNKTVEASEAVVKATQELKTTVLKFLDDTREYVLQSQLGTFKKIVLVASVIGFTAGVVIVALLPNIPLSILKRIAKNYKISGQPKQPEPKPTATIDESTLFSKIILN